MKGYEAAGLDVGQSLRTVEEPAGEWLLTSRKETSGHALCGIAWSVEGDGACLGEAAGGRQGCDQSSAEECHGLNRKEYSTVKCHLSVDAGVKRPISGLPVRWPLWSMSTASRDPLLSAAIFTTFWPLQTK